MTIKYSPGLSKVIAGKVAKRTDDAGAISFDSATSRIMDSNSNLVVNGFRIGDHVIVAGSVSNNGIHVIAAMAADGSHMTTGSPLADEAGGAAGTKTLTAKGKNLREALSGGKIHIYSGTAPTSVSAAETGTLLAVITNNELPVTPGNLLNTLTLEEGAAASLQKVAAQLWRGKNISTGTAAYFRLYDNAMETGDSEIAIRAQGTVSTSSTADLQILPTTTLQAEGVTSITEFNATLP